MNLDGKSLTGDCNRMLPMYIKAKSEHWTANLNTGLLRHIFRYDSSHSDTMEINVTTCDMNTYNNNIIIIIIIPNIKFKSKYDEWV